MIWSHRIRARVQPRAAGVAAIAPHAVEIAQADLMPAHGASARKRLERLADRAALPS